MTEQIDAVANAVFNELRIMPHTAITEEETRQYVRQRILRTFANPIDVLVDIFKDFDERPRWLYQQILQSRKGD